MKSENNSSLTIDQCSKRHQQKDDCFRHLRMENRAKTLFKLSTFQLLLFRRHTHSVFIENQMLRKHVDWCVPVCWCLTFYVFVVCFTHCCVPVRNNDIQVSTYDLSREWLVCLFYNETLESLMNVCVAFALIEYHFILESQSNNAMLKRSAFALWKKIQIQTPARRFPFILYFFSLWK